MWRSEVKPVGVMMEITSAQYGSCVLVLSARAGPAAAAAAPCGCGCGCGCDAVVGVVCKSAWPLLHCNNQASIISSTRPSYPHFFTHACASCPLPPHVPPPSHPLSSQPGRPRRRQCWVGVRGLEHEDSLGTHCGHYPSTSVDSQSSLPDRQQQQQGQRHHVARTTTKALPNHHHAPPRLHDRRGQWQQ